MTMRRRELTIYRVRLYAMPGVDAIRSLRSLLKVMLRRHGLRVLSLEIETPPTSGGKDVGRSEEAGNKAR